MSNQHQRALQNSSQQVEQSDYPETSSTKNSKIRPACGKDWELIISDWEQSGLTQNAYCHQHDIKKHIFTYYRNKHRPKSIEKTKRPLVPVKVTCDQNRSKPSSMSYQLTLPSGAILAIPDRYDKTNLQALLKLLGVCK